MTFKVIKTTLEEILHLRALFLAENNFQVRYNACHERDWSDSYLLLFNDIKAGYGSVKGQEIKDRDTIFEFYLTPQFRKFSIDFFKELLSVSGAGLIESQTNNIFFTSLLYQFFRDINSNVILFEDNRATNLILPKVTFRRKNERDFTFDH